MRKNLGVKTYLYPQPVLIIGTYDEQNVPDAMNAAWGGISDYREISICISNNHKTTKNILLKKAFTVSVGTYKTLEACDYFGIASANQVKDKIARVNFHPIKSEFVDAPLFEELPLALECKLISYDEESGILRGEIVNVSADETILNGQSIDPDKLEAISFDAANSAYLLVKGKVGNAFKDGKKYF